MICWFFDIKNIFLKGQKSEEKNGVPTASRPTQGGGSYGTIWYHMGPNQFFGVKNQKNRQTNLFFYTTLAKNGGHDDDSH